MALLKYILKKMLMLLPVLVGIRYYFTQEIVGRPTPKVFPA